MTVRIPIVTQRTQTPLRGMQADIGVAPVDNSIGRAIGNLGQVGQQEALRRLDEDVRTQAKEADVAYRQRLNAILYGEGETPGYMALQGRAALDARPQIEQQLAEARQQALAAAPNARAAQMFTQAADQLEIGLRRDIAEHATRQDRTYKEQVSTTRQQTATADFVRYWTVDQTRASGFLEQAMAEAGSRAEAAGLGPEVVLAERNRARAAAMQGLVTTLADVDPDKAEQVLRSEAGVIDPLFAADVRKRIEQTALQRDASEFVQGGQPFSFDQFWEQIKGFEGSALVADDNGAPSKFGVRANRPDGTYNGIPVANITEEQAREIYRRDYWQASGADKLPPALAAVVSDGAVNHGVGGIRRILRRLEPNEAKWSELDPLQVIAAREAEYRRLAAADPSKYGDDLNGWLNRMGRLRANVAALPAGELTIEQVRERARLAAGDDPTGQRYRTLEAAGMAELRTREAAVQQREQRAWDAVQPYLVEGAATNWTQIPAGVFNNLSPQQQTSIKNHFMRPAGEAQTDQMKYAQLAGLYATNPAEFARLDPSTYLGSLSASDFQTVVGWRTQALQQGASGARNKDQLSISRAMSLTEPMLTAAGVSTQGARGAKREEAAQQVAQFQGALLQEINRHRAQNQGEDPSEEQILRMGRRLLMKGYEGRDGRAEMFRFQMAPGARFASVIPADVRRSIVTSYQARNNGRTPTDAQVADLYRRGVESGMIRVEE